MRLKWKNNLNLNNLVYCIILNTNLRNGKKIKNLNKFKKITVKIVNNKKIIVKMISNN